MYPPMQSSEGVGERGLVIYLHGNFKYKLKLELNNYTKWEGQCIEIMR